MRGGSKLGIAVLFVLMVACSTTARSTRPSDAKASSALAYYPLFAGWGWAYEVERDGVTVLVPYPVIERGDDFAVVRNGDETIAYAISQAGIARRDGGVPGDFVLKTPVAVGAKWPVTAGLAKVIEGKDSVTLRSGTYRDCVVVEETRHGPDRITRTTYCKDTGPIEIEVRVLNAFSRAYEPVVHATLLSVTRPGD